MNTTFAVRASTIRNTKRLPSAAQPSARKSPLLEKARAEQPLYDVIGCCVSSDVKRTKQARTKQQRNKYRNMKKVKREESNPDPVSTECITRFGNMHLSVGSRRHGKIGCWSAPITPVRALSALLSFSLSAPVSQPPVDAPCCCLYVKGENT